MKKVLLLVVVAFAALSVLLMFGKNTVARIMVTHGVRLVTGLGMHIQRMDVQIGNSVVDVDGITISNPSGYEDKTMADIPKFYVRYDLPSLLKNSIHLPELRITVRELTAVRNKKGNLNLAALSALQSGNGQKAPARRLQIDSFRLDVDKVVFKDYSFGMPPAVREFPVSIHETFSDIRDPNALVAIIVAKALAHTTISAITNFDLQNVKGIASRGFSTAAAQTRDALNLAIDKTAAALYETPDVGNATKEVFKDTAGTLAGGVEELLSLPFGKKDDSKAK